jgi:putative endonuclease
LDARNKSGHDGTGMTRTEMRERFFYVYILAKQRHGALYVGVTNNLIRCVYEHREGLVAGFTKHYGIKQLVYYEQHATAVSAIQREKTMKHWLARLENPDNRKNEPHLDRSLRRDLPIGPIGWPGLRPPKR